VDRFDLNLCNMCEGLTGRAEGECDSSLGAVTAVRSALAGAPEAFECTSAPSLGLDYLNVWYMTCAGSLSYTTRIYTDGCA
jgi:hypothetical protein